jgi:hypothetical protein
VKDLELSTQIYKLMDALNAMTEAAPESKVKIFSWVKDVSPAARPEELYTSLARVFRMTVEEVKREVDPAHTRPNDFDDLVPTRGWIADYVDYTRNTEPPTVFHFFAGMMAVSTALSRNMYYDMGPYQLFPNLCVVIVAPSGRCKKTSACQMSVNMMNAIGLNVLADKLTPEVLVESLKERTRQLAYSMLQSSLPFWASRSTRRVWFRCSPDLWIVLTFGKVPRLCGGMQNSATWPLRSWAQVHWTGYRRKFRNQRLAVDSYRGYCSWCKKTHHVHFLYRLKWTRRNGAGSLRRLD